MLLYRGQTLGNPRTEADARPQLGTQGWYRACDGHDIRPACWMKGRRRGLAFTQLPPEFGSPSAQKLRTQALSPTATSATAPGARSITREPAASPFATPTPSDTTTTPRSRDSVRGLGRFCVPGQKFLTPVRRRSRSALDSLAAVIRTADAPVWALHWDRAGQPHWGETVTKLYQQKCIIIEPV